MHALRRGASGSMHQVFRGGAVVAGSANTQWTLVGFEECCARLGKRSRRDRGIVPPPQPNRGGKRVPCFEIVVRNSCLGWPWPRSHAGRNLPVEPPPARVGRVDGRSTRRG